MPSSQDDYIDIDAEGAITDGDDNILSRDPTLLNGGGGWRNLELFSGGNASDHTVNKRKSRSESVDIPQKRVRGDYTGGSPDSEIPEIIDLTSSSPPPAEILRSSSAISIEDDGDDEDHVSTSHPTHFFYILHANQIYAATRTNQGDVTASRSI